MECRGVCVFVKGVIIYWVIKRNDIELYCKKKKCIVLMFVWYLESI